MERQLEGLQSPWCQHPGFSELFSIVSLSCSQNLIRWDAKSYEFVLRKFSSTHLFSNLVPLALPRGMTTSLKVQEELGGWEQCLYPRISFWVISTMTVTTPSQTLTFGLGMVSLLKPWELRCSLLGGFFAVSWWRVRGLKGREAPKEAENLKTSQTLFQPFPFCWKFPPDNSSLLFLLGNFICWD